MGASTLVTPFRNQLVGRDGGIAIEARGIWLLGNSTTRRSSGCALYQEPARGPRSRRAVGETARSRRDLDHRQSESLPFICEWVEAVALLPQAWRDTARAMSQENVEIVRAMYGGTGWGYRGDSFPSSYFDPDVEGTRGSGRPGPRNRTGANGEVFEALSRTTGRVPRCPLRPEDRGRKHHRTSTTITSWCCLGIPQRGKLSSVPIDSRQASEICSRCVSGKVGPLTALHPESCRCSASRRAVGVAARSRRDLDHRQSESLPFICEWVEERALSPASALHGKQYVRNGRVFASATPP